MTSSIKVRARRCKGTLATASLVDEDGGRARGGGTNGGRPQGGEASGVGTGHERAQNSAMEGARGRGRGGAWACAWEELGETVAWPERRARPEVDGRRSHLTTSGSKEEAHGSVGALGSESRGAGVGVA
jgi:hypothetical protein